LAVLAEHEDADVGRFLKLFTDLPLDEIARLEALPGAEINEAKIVLADAATAMLHGEACGRAAAETARETFEGGAGEPADAEGRSDGIGIVHAPDRAGLCASNGEARRKIAEGAVKLDARTVSDPALMVVSGRSTARPPVKLSSARRSTGCSA
jgi:tyrosyl-tRNA synthetase